jgi:cytochrome c oxidase subunit 2
MGGAMVDSGVVLWGQAIIYTLYAFAVLIVMAVFVYHVVRTGPSRVPTWLFLGWAGVLVVTGVSIHLFTANTIPWVPDDLERPVYVPGEPYPEADRVFEIAVADHAFRLPAGKLEIACGERVLFDVSTADLTYGFGLFRPNHTMLFQMQVVPGHPNQLLWTFERNGLYTIRSTEYSGPDGHQMIVPDSVEVTGCDTTDA